MDSLKIYLIKTKNSKVYCIRCGDTLQAIVDTNKKIYGNVLDVSNVSSKKELEKLVEQKGTIENFKNDIVYCGDHKSKEFKESKHKIKIHIGSPQDEITVKKTRLEEEKPESFLDILPPEILGGEIFKYITKSDFIALMASNSTIFTKLKSFFLENSYFDINDFLVYQEIGMRRYEVIVKDYIKIGQELIFIKEINNLILKNPENGSISSTGTLVYIDKFSEEDLSLNYNTDDVDRIYPLNVLEGFTNLKRIKLVNPNSPELTFFKELSSLERFDKNIIKEVYYEIPKHSPYGIDENLTEYYVKIEFMNEKGVSYLPNGLEAIKLPSKFDWVIYKAPYLSEETKVEIQRLYGVEGMFKSVFPNSLRYLDMRTEYPYNGDIESLYDLTNLRFLAINVSKNYHPDRLPPNIETYIFETEQPNDSKTINFKEYKNLKSLELHRYAGVISGSIFPNTIKKLNLQYPYDFGKKGELKRDPLPASIEEFTIRPVFREPFDFESLQEGLKKLTIFTNYKDTNFDKLPKTLEYIYYYGPGFIEDLRYLKNLKKLILKHNFNIGTKLKSFNSRNFPERLEELELELSHTTIFSKSMSIELPVSVNKLKIRITDIFEQNVKIYTDNEKLFVDHGENIILEFEK